MYPTADCPQGQADIYRSIQGMWELRKRGLSNRFTGKEAFDFATEMDCKAPEVFGNKGYQVVKCTCASDIYAALGKMHRSVHRRLLCQRAIQAARGQQNAAPQGPRPAGQEGWPPPRPAGG